jgi:hypothetical protein
MREIAQSRLGDPYFDMLGYVESHKNRPQVPMYEDNPVTEFEGTKNIYDAAYRLVFIKKTNPDGSRQKSATPTLPSQGACSRA